MDYKEKAKRTYKKYLIRRKYLENGYLPLLDYIKEKHGRDYTRLQYIDGFGVCTEFYADFWEEDLNEIRIANPWSVPRLVWIKRYFNMSWVELGAVLDQIYPEEELANLIKKGLRDSGLPIGYHKKGAKQMQKIKQKQKRLDDWKLPDKKNSGKSPEGLKKSNPKAKYIDILWKDKV